MATCESVRIEAKIPNSLDIRRIRGGRLANYRDETSLSLSLSLHTHTQPAIRRSKISIAILMQKRASAVKNWIACKIDQPRVVKSLERLAETRHEGQRSTSPRLRFLVHRHLTFRPVVSVFYSEGRYWSHRVTLAARSLLYTTLVHVVSLHTAGKILYSNTLQDFRSKNYASRSQDGITIFLSSRCEYRIRIG